MKNFQRNRFFRKNKKGIVFTLLCVLLSLAGIVCYCYFNAEQIQNKIEEKVCSLVLEHEEELVETIEECRANEIKYLTFRDARKDDDDDNSYYKDLNSKTVNKMFRTFRLLGIHQWESDNGNIVHFWVRQPIISVLWEDYGCGFYYTEQDKAFDVWDSKECEEETEEIVLGLGKYWYRTKQIDTHWWFYESKIVERYWVKW